jgi:hypothetical protein
VREPTDIESPTNIPGRSTQNPRAVKKSSPIKRF